MNTSCRRIDCDERFSLFCQVRPVYSNIFFKIEGMGFKLCKTESPFLAHRCMEGLKELLRTLDKVLMQYRLLVTQNFVSSPYLFIFMAERIKCASKG